MYFLFVTKRKVIERESQNFMNHFTIMLQHVT